MPDYTYDDYVYFHNSVDAPKEHHNYFILNQKLDFYITSLSKLMDDTLTSFPNLFVDGMIKNGLTLISKLLLSYQES